MLSLVQVNSNSTLPVSVSSVSVLHAPHTRRSFLQRAVQPLLDTGKHGPAPLSDVLREVSSVADKLQRLGILDPNVTWPRLIEMLIQHVQARHFQLPALRLP